MDNDDMKTSLVQVTGVVQTEEIDPNRDPRKADHTRRLTGRDNLFSIHSAALVTNTSIATYGPNQLTFIPERVFIVARLSAGSLQVHFGSSRSPAHSIRMDRGTIVLPMEAEAITVETAGATGFFDIYFVIGHKELQIVS